MVGCSIDGVLQADDIYGERSKGLIQQIDKLLAKSALK